jgi:branched-chain amino acid transport system substrate-binding protein
MSTQFKAILVAIIVIVAAAGAYVYFKRGEQVTDTIVLGAAVSLTGKYSTNGKHTQNGYNLAATRINERGGVKIGGKAYKLKIIYYDDESTPARGAQLAERLIKQDGVKYLLGPYSSGLTKAIAPVTEKYKVPMVEGNGASKSLFTQGYKYLFAVLSSTEFYLKEAINLAAEQAKKAGRDPKTLTVAMAFENDPFSQDVRAGVEEDAKRYGMKIVIDDKLPPELNDMAATLTKVKALKPDVLVISGHAKGAALAVRQVADMKVDAPMLAMTHCDSARVIEKFKEKANYTLCASQWDRALNYRDGWFGTAEEYAQAYEKAFNESPPYQAAESTAAVLTFVDAFQRAGSLDPEKVRTALTATNMQTFYGNIKFDATGKNIAKPMVLYQVQDQKYKVVAPSKWATSKLIHPTPSWDKR